eukprot:gnl/Spiro4/18073_TR9654_c1_g1_i1.p1 gnl/Spiro4/18073_TR9654_c1_g1~~gnl/Spiro4/18073_TR9654_c1_g1_i1.p1  ORF type:complete len:268 (+),score=50.47 gnl/Spiro4/18073_TR9654_c1_g1_i1:32-805(+)
MLSLSRRNLSPLSLTSLVHMFSSRGEPPVVLQPKTAKCSGTVIFMHGLGDRGASWASCWAELHDKIPHVRFICPTAPERPVTLNMGMVMPAWYDLSGLSSRENERCDGIEQSRATIEALIESEKRAGVPSNRIVLAGFSQGGAMALYCGLQFAQQLAGVLAMSSYLPRPTALTAIVQQHKTNLQTPVLMCHGDWDQVVQLAWARTSLASLQKMGVQRAELKVYPNMQHEANDAELRDALAFLNKVLPEPQPQLSSKL